MVSWTTRCAVGMAAIGAAACGDDGGTTGAGGDGGGSAATTNGVTTTATVTTTASATSSTTTTTAGAGGAGGGTGTGGTTGAGGAGGEDGLRIVGVVTGYRFNEATLEQRVVGARVEVTDGDAVWVGTSDPQGVFAIEGVPPGEGYRVTVTVPEQGDDVRFNGDTYGRWHETLTVLEGVDTPLAPVLARGCTTPITVEAGQPGAFSAQGFECGAVGAAFDTILEIPADGLVDADGNAFSGPAKLKLTPLYYPDLQFGGEPDLLSVRSMPGDLIGTDGADPSLIHTYAAADVRVVADDTGEELQVADGATALLTMRAWRTMTEDEEILSWSFDVEQNAWVEEGICTVDPDDAQRVTCDVRHFSWWNADGRDTDDPPGPPAPTRCVYGGVVYEGTPVAGALVSAITSEGLAGGGEVQTDPAGAFCIGSHAPGPWRVQVRMPNDRVVLQARVAVAAQTASQASCSDSADDCAQAGIIELEEDEYITVRGTIGICDESLYPAEICGPFDAGFWQHGLTMRVIGFLPSREKDFYLGDTVIDADGTFEVRVPEEMGSLIFATPNSRCDTDNMFIPGGGDDVEIQESGYFTCDS